MRLELSDLPPWARAQAEKQLAASRRDGGTIAAAAKAARATGREFDSRGEYEFYMGTVLPGMASGEIVKCEQHPQFILFPESEYNGIKLRRPLYCGFPAGLCGRLCGDSRGEKQVCQKDAAGLPCAAACISGTGASVGVEVPGNYHDRHQGGR